MNMNKIIAVDHAKGNESRFSGGMALDNDNDKLLFVSKMQSNAIEARESQTAQDERVLHLQSIDQVPWQVPIPKIPL